MGRKYKLTESIEHRAYIRVEDEDNWNMMKEVAECSEQYKSTNAIVNAALTYGLPLLLKDLKGEVELPPAEDIRKEYSEYELEQMKYYGTVVRLMKELILNVLLCKSMCSQLVNVQIEEATGNYKEKLEQGALSDTPDFLVDYEARELKRIRQS